MKNFFKRATAPVVLSMAMMTASVPAFAGKDFIKKDFREETTEVVQLLGQDLSHDKLTFVVHGGENVLLLAAYRVAQRLDDEGVPVAFLLAPDHDGIPESSHVDFYTKGGTEYFVIGFSNGDMGSYENTMYDQAMKAYREDFPEFAKKTHPAS